MRDEAGRAALHLAAIVESSDDAIISKDLIGTITSWNRAAARMFGYDVSEAIGRSIRMLIPADRQSEEDDVLARIRSGQTVDHFETIRVHKDGALIDISLTVSPIRDADGTIVGASKIARDITKQKRIAAALAQAEARRDDLQHRLLALTSASAKLLESPRRDDVLPAILSLASELVTADGYAVWRLDGSTGEWAIASHAGVSDAFAAFRGKSPGAAETAEALLVEDVETLAVPDERRAAFRREGIRSLLAIPLALGADGEGSLVFYYRQRQGFSDVDVQAARALGNLAAAALNIADLYEEQRRGELQARFLAEVSETLAQSLDYRQTLTAVARLAVPGVADWCAVDVVKPDGELENLALTHVDPDKVALAEEFRRRHPSDPASPYTSEHVIATGEPAMLGYVSGEMVASSARDPEHLEALRRLGITSFMCVPLRTRAGVIGTITFVSAESGRRYGDEDLRFAEAVAVRASLAIENAQAYEQVREANRLKDDFLATLSHELRTPLNAILGYTRMMRTKAVPPERREKAMETVERNAVSLAQIVDDVLDVSRVVAGKLGIQFQPVLLSRLLDHAVATVLPAAQAKGVQVRTHVAADVQTIVADPDRLQQVLWNLLSNAVKFTSRGGKVTVDAKRTETEVVIVVSDTGEGIAREFLPYVFERFRQADSRLAGVRGGLGIGLAIARHIVEMHGGRIDAESEGVGKGATFRIRLPAVVSGREPASSPVAG